ncbi:MAG TPA: hypothetical protein VE988_06400 [Gemmataceae bacterium]|nr:hypothetical protein [Gemmataceae bacterium]
MRPLKRRQWRAAALLVTLVWTGGWLFAAPDKQGQSPETSGEGDPTLSGWEWMQEIRLPKTNSKYCAIALPPTVLGKAQQDLSDLRLADAAGTRLPFALRVLRTTVIQKELPLVRQYDAGPVAAKGCYEVSLELGEMADLGHNEIEIVTAGKNYRRKVEILGDNKASFDSGRQLLDKDKYLVHFELEGTVVDIRKLRYETNKVRFLKVRVYADTGSGEPMPKIDKVTVRYAEAIKGEDVTWPATLEDREPVKTDAGPGSAWYIQLGPDPVPCERLSFTVNGVPVERPFRLEVADTEGQKQFLLQDLDAKFETVRHWKWHKSGERWQLDIDFLEEVRARRLRLTVTDFANPPLEPINVSYTAAMRQVIFALPDPAKYKFPLGLYFGNPKITPANYDFAQQLPATLTPPPQRITLGDFQGNPAYVPPALPLSERAPWLIYVMLGATSAVLLAVLLLLARTAIRRHDAAQSAV